MNATSNRVDDRELPTVPCARWSDALLLGYPEMDATHKEFVALVGELQVVPAAGAIESLRRLRDHTVSHFDEERRWMVDTAFPAIDCHLDEHAAVMASLDGVLELQSGNGVDLDRFRSLAHALAEWFPGHAQHMDSALAQWLCRDRFGGAPVVLRRKSDLASGH